MENEKAWKRLEFTAYFLSTYSLFLIVPYRYGWNIRQLVDLF
jgi:hypothetical protein